MKQVRCSILFLAIITVAFSSLMVMAAETEVKKGRKSTYEVVGMEEKSLSGEVVYISTQSEKQVIGVTRQLDGADYYFSFDENVKVINKKDLTGINIGDTVEITFRELYKQSKEGKEKTDRIAAQIRFVKPAKMDKVLDSK